MKLIALLFVVVFAVQALSVDWKKTQNERRLFDMWMREHNKTYPRAGEKEMRFINFQKSLARIEKLNQKHTSAHFAVNAFSDQTPEEFFAARTGQKTPAQTLARSCLANGVTAERMDTSAVPTSFDWRTSGKVTPVKDQGQCGSCWTFSTTGAIESAWAIKKGLSTPVSLSEQMIVDCSTGCINEPPYGNVCNQGCDGGWPFSAMQDIISWGGLESETAYPYTAEDGTCAKSTQKIVVKISNYTCLTNPNANPVDETQMAAVLAAKGPLSIAMDAGLLMDYSSGIINPQSGDCSDNQLDHAILIVGYGVDTTQNLPYWIVKNSWNASWGEQGYFRIVRGQGACGLNAAVTLPVV
jgi:cathepsin F